MDAVYIGQLFNGLPSINKAQGITLAFGNSLCFINDETCMVNFGNKKVRRKSPSHYLCAENRSRLNTGRYDMRTEAQ